MLDVFALVKREVIQIGLILRNTDDRCKRNCSRWRWYRLVSIVTERTMSTVYVWRLARIAKHGFLLPPPRISVYGRQRRNDGSHTALRTNTFAVSFTTDSTLTDQSGAHRITRASTIRQVHHLLFNYPSFFFCLSLHHGIFTSVIACWTENKKCILSFSLRISLIRMYVV